VVVRQGAAVTPGRGPKQYHAVQKHTGGSIHGDARLQTPVRGLDLLCKTESCAI